MLIRLRVVFLQELVTKNNSIKVKLNVPYSYTQFGKPAGYSVVHVYILIKVYTLLVNVLII